MVLNINGIQDNIIKINSAIEAEDKEALYELLTLFDRLYSKEIPEISDSFEEVKRYNGTLFRNARVVSSILDDYVTTHSCICFSQIESDDEELNKLISSSFRLYNNNELSLATEKIWDAFERLKTYYSPTLDKLKSVEKIVDDMSDGCAGFREMYEAEFKALTKIGNDFRIRHHETTKIDISDSRQYNYFYKRCLVLISVAILYLQGGSAA